VSVKALRGAFALAAGLAVAAAALGATPGVAPAPATASGKFEDRKWKLDIAGAYAFWGRTSGLDDDEVIRVAVSNTEFKAAAFDDHYDKGHAISMIFADDENKVVYFEFDGHGRYLGLAYYFESGDGCGFCYDSKVKSTVRAAEGRLSGSVAYDGDGYHFDVAFDVPLPAKTWGDALPKDGGAPGKVYLAYAAALEKEDQKTVYALLDADMKARWDKYEKDGELDSYVEFLWHDVHTAMKTIRLTGGFTRGDRAVVLLDGSSAVIDHLDGEALLRQEGGRWLVHTEMVDVGTR
jgi:hypothetical protein